MKDKKNVYKLLLKLAGLVSEKGADQLFGGPQDLLGFKLQRLTPELHESLCREFGFDPADSETVLMQAGSACEAHLHERGESVFLPLGKLHGFPDSGGGFVSPRIERGGKFDVVPFQFLSYQELSHYLWQGKIPEGPSW